MLSISSIHVDSDSAAPQQYFWHVPDIQEESDEHAVPGGKRGVVVVPVPVVTVVVVAVVVVAVVVRLVVVVVALVLVAELLLLVVAVVVVLVLVDEVVVATVVVSSRPMTSHSAMEKWSPPQRLSITILTYRAALSTAWLVVRYAAHPPKYSRLTYSQFQPLLDTYVVN